MEDSEFCRICLIKGVKMIDMRQYNLLNGYESIIGCQKTVMDDQILYTCVYCSTLLAKFDSFKEKCQRSNEILKLLSSLTNSNVFISADSQVINLTFSRINIIDCSDTESELKTEPSEYEDDYKTDEGEVEGSEDEMEMPPVLLSEILNKHKDNVKVLKTNTKPEDITNYNVITLTKEQQIEDVENRKNTENYLKALYKCDKCYKGYLMEGTYKNHMTCHDKANGSHVCDICHMVYKKNKSLRLHHQLTHEKRYICKLCGYIAKNKNRAHEHDKWHNGYSYKCKICGLSFDKPTSVLTHERLQHPSKHCCKICGESFISEYGVQVHKRKAHKDKQQVKNENEKGTHNCTSCDIDFNTKDALKTHADICNTDITLSSCSNCGKSFENSEALKKHMKEHDKKYRCEECKRAFRNERYFAVHYQRFHLGKVVQKTFANFKKVCEICGRKFVSNSALVYHQRSHTGEKPYLCNLCPKRFGNKQRLQIHIRTHTNERPFSCEFCGKGFKHKAALNRHVRVHTGIRPYVCNYCSKAFSQSNSMKVHINTVHLKLPAPYRNRRKTNENE